MQKLDITIKVRRTRHGNCLRVTHSEMKNKLNIMMIDGIQDRQQMIDSLRIQLEFLLPEIAGIFQTEIGTAKERYEATRKREMEHQRKMRLKENLPDLTEELKQGIV